MANHVFNINRLWKNITSYVNARLQSLSDLTDDDIREVCDFEDGMDENAVVPKATADMLGCVKVGDGLNVDDGVLSNGGIQKKLLWTNASPSSAFATQTISLDFSKYDPIRDQVEVEWRGLKSANHYGFTRFAIGSYGQINIFTHVDSTADTTNPPYIFNRNVVVGVGQIDFSGCVLRLSNSSTYATLQNDYIIPIRIYIVKGAQ